MVERLPPIADQLVGHIPRLEPVREILAAQTWRYDGNDAPLRSARGDAIPLGARMLKLAMAFDALESSGLAVEQAFGSIEADEGAYDPKLVHALRRAVAPGRGVADVRELPVQALRPGMVLVDDVRSRTGTLLVARGLAVSAGLVERMKNLPPGTVKEPIRVVLEHSGS
jgi:hypothetical protein